MSALPRLLLALIAAALALPTWAAKPPRIIEGAISQRDSYRIGSAGVLCTAQRRSEDPRYRSLFDRGYDITCRDAAAPIGSLYVMRRSGNATGAVLADLTNKHYTCRAPVAAGDAVPAGGRKVECVDPEVGLNHTLYVWQRGDSVFAAEGISAYDSALRLGLKSLIADRPVTGAVEVASTLSGDPAALARLQAERLDAAQALAAAYGHANDGAYVEAAQFFDTLVERSRDDPLGNAHRVEYLVNLAMSQSTLGNRAQADRLFEEAERAGASSDPALGRLYRNLKAMHFLSSGDPKAAIKVLDAPLGEGAASRDYPRERLAQGYIDKPLSQRLSLDDVGAGDLSGTDRPLTDVERATLLDAQADYLRGVGLRLTGDPAGARRALDRSLAAYESVRGGKVVSMAWLPAGISTETAVIAGTAGDRAGEQAGLQHAVDLLTLYFPDTAALLSAQARLAAWKAANGQRDQALADFRALVVVAPSVPDGTEALREWIGPYLDTLVASADQPGRADDFFAASQLMVRPGVAQTQAVLAREFSAGSDEAAELFRQSVNVSREVITLDAEAARLGALETRSVAEDQELAAAKANRARAALIQTQLTAKLAAYPKYRVVTNDAINLAGLCGALKSGEAYYQLLLVKGGAYAMLARPQGARIFRVGASGAELEALSNSIRDSVVREEGGQLVTDPFNLAAARRMYVLLFGPAEADLAQVHHLIFEPDGPLLKLPATLLVTDQPGVDAYAARQKKANADPFDFTGVSWLGRARIVSTSVSPRSFIQVRAIAPSTAGRTYIGFGQNEPARDSPLAPSPTSPRGPCDWPLATWNDPVSGAGLTVAERALGGNGDEVITGQRFSDTALRERTDMAQYRVIEFATHGLVTAPHPGCPARPALVTSWGKTNSDGLLSFREIFDLRLNADTVVLSACDTAGAATAAATREAGVSTGGNFALDGLVRAFVGAGARSVIASHWPVPDDFHATERLIGGLYKGSTTQPVGEAMRNAQLALMDDPTTSHPYYWAAFAIVGDAAKPITTQRSASSGATGGLAGGAGADGHAP